VKGGKLLLTGGTSDTRTELWLLRRRRSGEERRAEEELRSGVLFAWGGGLLVGMCALSGRSLLLSLCSALLYPKCCCLSSTNRSATRTALFIPPSGGSVT
jgi:hypothetical protein